MGALKAAPQLRLGIDGGGSRTRFLLVDEDDRELAGFETGPSNWLSVGREAAERSLAEGIARLPAPPAVACGGFAGAGRPEGARFFEETLRALLPNSQVLIETDVFVAYAGALGLQPGVLLIAGTGSIALGLTTDGKRIRAGGWGPVFGDEGSGFWIGREAIRIALRSQDRGEFPEFIEALRDALGVETISAAVAQWSNGTLNTPGVASLARIVIEQYPKEPARRIVDDAARHLRELVETVQRQTGLGACPKSIVGSVGSNPTVQQLIGFPFTPPLHPPERGAILWSRERLP